MNDKTDNFEFERGFKHIPAHIDTAESERRFSELRKHISPSYIKTIIQHISTALGSDVLPNTKVELLREPEVLSGGKRRSTYKLKTNYGSYVISIANHTYNLRAEHELQRYLYKKEAPVAKLIGGLGTLPSGKQFQVTEFISRKDKNTSSSPHTTQDMEAYGAALGKLHKVSGDYFKPTKPNHNGASWKYAEELLATANAAEKFAVKKSLKDDTPIPKSVTHAARHLRKMAYDLPDKKLESGFAHEDAHCGNVVMNETGQAFIIDLETCKEGIPLRDVAFAILWISMREKKEGDVLHVTFNDDNTAAFLKGYESGRGKLLSEEEKKTIFDFIKIQAKTSATISQLGGFNSAMTPDNYMQWNHQIDSWVDRIAVTHSAAANQGNPRD